MHLSSLQTKPNKVESEHGQSWKATSQAEKCCEFVRSSSDIAAIFGSGRMLTNVLQRAASGLARDLVFLQDATGSMGSYIASGGKSHYLFDSIVTLITLPHFHRVFA